MDAAGLLPVSLGNETVHGIIFPQNLAAGGHLDAGEVAAFIIGVSRGGESPAAVLPVDGAGVLYHPPGGSLFRLEVLIPPLLRQVAGGVIAVFCQAVPQSAAFGFWTGSRFSSSQPTWL